MSDNEWILKNMSSGDTELDGQKISWVAVPNRPGREPFTTEEILGAFRSQAKGEDE